MKKIIWTMCMLLTTLTASADDRTYSVGSFDGLKCGGAVTIEYTTGNSNEVRAKGSKTLLDKYEVFVKNGTLIIRPKKEKITIKKNETVTFYVTAAALNQLGISGACTFNAGTLIMNGTRMEVSGASRLNTGTVKTKNLNLGVSGATSISIKSLASNNLKGMISGASNLDIKKLTAEVVNLGFSGACNCDIDDAITQGNFTLDCSGSCNFDLTANTPGTVDVRGSGTSKGELDVNCKLLKISTSGVSNIRVRANEGAEKEVNTSGNSRIRFK